MSRLVFFTGAMTASRSSALTSGDSSMTTILARLPRMVPTEKLSIFEPFFNVQMPLLRDSCTARWESAWISRMISGLRMK